MENLSGLKDWVPWSKYKDTDLMCAIWGLGLLNGSVVKDASVIKTIVKKLAAEGQIRGKDATGVAFCSEKEVVVVKSAVKGVDFVKSKELDTALARYADIHAPNSPISIIGHNRGRTKGSELISDNNHPIVADDIVGVHNGMIHNDDITFKREGLYRQARVDSEVIFRLLDKFANKEKLGHEESIRRTVNRLNGTFAFASVSRQDPYVLYLVKGTNPIFLRLFKKVGLFIFASTERMLDNAVRDLPVGPATNKYMIVDSAFVINLYYNQYIKMDLREHLEGYA